MIPLEIERKYIIEKPSEELFKNKEGHTESKIIQTYLESRKGATRRVRSRDYGTHKVYTLTEKVRIDRMSSYEDEREITEEEYTSLLSLKKKGTAPIKKTRHTMVYLDKTIEIDYYPAWQSIAVLETELSSIDETVSLPTEIKVLCEVTGDKRFSNAGLSESFPEESFVISFARENGE